MIARLASVVGIFVLSAAPLFGQGAVSEFNGSVVDQSSGALPGVTVTVTEETTGLVRTVVSNEVGRFVIPALTPGRYTLRAELAGFQTQTRAGVQIGVGQSLTLNFTLPVGTLQDQVTVTGESPLVEVTQTEIGTNMTTNDIENMPLQGREQYALLQLVPGLTPSLQAGSFEGAAYNANGRDTGSNLFMIDGQYNKDDRTMTQAQARVTVDSMAEFQVLTHEYGAEYGGSSGVIINAITKSGTNEYHGRGFAYYQDESLNATNYFLEKAGQKNAESGRQSFGANMGGPIVRNKAFWFFNYEYSKLNEALNLQFPASTAPLAVSYSDNYLVHLTNYFGRVDYQFSPSHTINGRFVYGPNDGIGENAESERTTPEGFRYERAPGETLYSFQLTSVFGSNKVNEFKAGSTNEDLWIGDRRVFNEDFNDIPFDTDTEEFVGLSKNAGVDNILDFGSANAHPDYTAGPRTAQSGAQLFARTFSNQFTWTPASHTVKLGVGFSNNLGTNIVAGNQNGTFSFLSNAAFDPANASTYPSRFQVRTGELFLNIDDKRYNWYAADKWQLTDQISLNLGLRWDYSEVTPETKNAFAPRLGIAYSPNPQTVIRGGFGKFYEYPTTSLLSDLFQGRVISTVFTFDTGEDTSSTRGVRPAAACLNPVATTDGQGNPGMAKISPACRAQLDSTIAQLEAGGFVNTEPLLDGTPRKLGFLYQYSAGVTRELFQGIGLTVDWVASRGRDQTARLDINEPVNGVRPGAAGFDPTGELIPAQARNANYQRVLQYVTSDLFNSDYDALEISVERRLANRWSGRASYTLSRAHDVNGGTTGGSGQINKRVNDDFNPRKDYGLTNFDNRHAFATGGNWQAWRGLGIGATFRFYSGNPINETVGSDANGDRDNTDRPVAGVNDATLAIVSPLDANGMAIRNGIDGESKGLLDLRVQYILTLGQRQQTMGFFLELYNATNAVNFVNPTGNRRSADFLVPVTADDPRSAQLGFRYTF